MTKEKVKSPQAKEVEALIQKVEDKWQKEREAKTDKQIDLTEQLNDLKKFFNNNKTRR